MLLLITSAIQSNYGVNSIHLADPLKSLGLAYGKRGNVQLKKELLERVVKIQESYYEKDNFTVRHCLCFLCDSEGSVGGYKMEGDYKNPYG